MPTGLSIAIRFLYMFLFLCFVGISLMQPTMHWLDAKFGIWVMWGCAVTYIGIMVGSVGLINKINRDWPTYDLPPQARSGRGQQVEMVTDDMVQGGSFEKSHFAKPPLETENLPRTKT